MFLRPDFLNLTICLVGVYMMFNTERITKNKFRMLFFGVVLSIVYDLIWFNVKHQEYAPDESPKSAAGASDGSTEADLRKFSLTMSYASFIFRVRECAYHVLVLVLRGHRLLERFHGLRKDYLEPNRRQAAEPDSVEIPHEQNGHSRRQKYVPQRF